MNNFTSSKTEKWYTQFWPWFLIILPGTVVLASLITIYLAASQPKDTLDHDITKFGLSATPAEPETTTSNKSEE